MDEQPAKVSKPNLRLVPQVPPPVTAEGAGAPAQAEMPFAVVEGEPVTELPRDLYIPPYALEVFLEAFGLDPKASPVIQRELMYGK